MTDHVEFYFDGKAQPFCTVESSFQPDDDDLINIRKHTYKVLGRSFTVDSPSGSPQTICCNVIVEEAS